MKGSSQYSVFSASMLALLLTSCALGPVIADKLSSGVSFTRSVRFSGPVPALQIYAPRLTITADEAHAASLSLNAKH